MNFQLNNTLNVLKGNIFSILQVIALLCTFPTVTLSKTYFYSRNGYVLPSQGVVRALVVFAEPDSSDAKYFDSQFCVSSWQPGKLPLNASNLFDTVPLPLAIGEISKYYQQTSLGHLSIVGDYFPELVTIPSLKLQTYDFGFRNVIKTLDSIATEKGGLITANGYSVRAGDFDKLTLSQNLFGNTKPTQPDGSIDLLIVIFRCHPKINNNSGFGNYNQYGSIDGMKSISAFVLQVAPSLDTHIITHELSHMLLGPNSFHSGGSSAGIRKVLNLHAGHGILSASGTNLGGPSAWDRHRLGWLKDSLECEISDASGLCSDIILDSLSEDSISFVLRDFTKYGDAVRIEIPNSGSNSFCENCEKQWIWLENYQMLDDQIFSNDCKPKGLRVNVQIGNDDLYSKKSTTQYYVPLIKRGNYDFKIQQNVAGQYQIVSDEMLSNKFTGTSISQLPMYYDSDFTKLKGSDNIFQTEVMLNGKLLDEDSCCFQRYPNYGTSYDAFSVGDSLTISSNPSPVNIPTYYVQRRSTYSYKGKNNEYIHLNNLAIYIRKATFSDTIQGDMLEVVIKRNSNKINGVQRWCGKLLLYDSLVLENGTLLKIDWGLTPVRGDSPTAYHDSILFSDPAILRCLANSVFLANSHSLVQIKNGSQFVADSASEIILGKKVKMQCMDSASIVLKEGSTLFAEGKCLIELQGNHSKLVLKKGALFYEKAGQITAAVGENARPKPLIKLLQGKIQLDGKRYVLLEDVILQRN